MKNIIKTTMILGFALSFSNAEFKTQIGTGFASSSYMDNYGNGSYSNKSGNTYSHSDGSYTFKNGNSYRHSDGSYTNKVGNTYYNSDGSSYRVINGVVYK